MDSAVSQALSALVEAPSDATTLDTAAGLSDPVAEAVEERLSSLIDKALRDPELRSSVGWLSRTVAHVHKVRTQGEATARADWQVAEGQITLDVPQLVTQLHERRQRLGGPPDLSALSELIDLQQQLLDLAAFDYLPPPLQVTVIGNQSEDRRHRFDEVSDALSDVPALLDLGTVVAHLVRENPPTRSWWPSLAVSALELAAWLNALQEVDAQVEFIDGAVNLSGSVVESADPAWPGMPAALSAHGSALLLKGKREASVEYLDRAITELSRSIEGAPQTPMSLGSQKVRGDAHVVRFDLLRDAADLQQACDDYQAVIASAGPMAAAAQYALANVLHRRYELSLVAGDLDAARQAYEAALDITPIGDVNRPIAGAGLAVVQVSSFDRDGQVEHLDRAIDYFSEVRDAYPPGTEARAGALYNLGNTYRKRFERTHELADESAAEAAFKESLSASDMVGLPQRLAHYCLAVHSRLMREGAAELQQFLDLERMLVSATATYSQTALSFSLWQALGLIRLDMYARTQARSDLDGAISALESANPNTALDRVLNLNFRAEALRKRWVQSPTDVDQELVTALYERCCTEAISYPQTTLEAGKSWGYWAAQRGAWEEAREAFGFAAQAIEILYGEQLTVQDEQLWLSDAQGVYSELAYAAAKCGDPLAAALALETGRARLLAELTGRDRGQLERLEREAPRLHARLREVIAQLRAHRLAGLASDVVPDPEATTARRAQFRRLVEEVRSIDGYGDFFAGVRSADVLAAGGDPPLLYITPASQGGLLISVASSVEAFVLPGLTTETAFGWTATYLQAYENWRTQPSSPKATRTFETVLRGTTAWLGEQVLELVRNIAKGGRAVLVPIGPLQLFPIHAASVEDPLEPGSRVSLCDDVVLSQVASAGQLLAARRRMTDRCSTVVTVTAPPGGGQADLPYSHMEAAVVRAFFEEGHDISETAELMGALPQCDVIHFACHATADIRSPMKSRLVLGNAVLTLDELLNVELNARLAVLSACETAVPGIDLLDESLSLSNALCSAGCAGVVATLWPVADLYTAMMTCDFYRRWLLEHAEPAEALRDAQRWLRDTTNAEKLATFDELKEIDKLPPGVVEGFRSALLKRKPDAHECSPLVLWAPIIYTGC